DYCNDCDSDFHSYIRFVAKFATGVAIEAYVADNEARPSIDVIGDFKGLRAMVFCQGQIREKALKRDLKIRIITDKMKGEPQRKFSELENGSSFQVRYVPAPMAIRLAIYDKKKVNLSVQEQWMKYCHVFGQIIQYWQIVMAFFEELWETSDQLSDKNKSA
ncbi:MAG: hypothetical protein ACXV2C_08405, partial [Candidatus Bathyarchaeia archaeon]